MHAIRILIYSLLLLGLFAVPVYAQNPAPADDTALYVVSDVQADVSADNAVKARDKAIAQAQRDAFTQLVQRLGSSDAVTKNLSDDDIAAMVKSFQVQNEHASSVRYIGSFTVQFRPNTVKRYLDKHKATYNETRSDPVLILPIQMSGDKPVLWEDKTKWHTVWDNSAATQGLVPVIVPAGDLEDIAAISTAEAVGGKNLKPIIEKYKTHGAVVAILSGDLDKASTPLKIDLTHFDANGDAQDSATLNIPVASKSTLDSSLARAVQQVRQQIEKDWQSEEKKPKQEAVQVFDGAVTIDPPEAGVEPAPKQDQPTFRLPVIVAINSIPEWVDIEHKLEGIPQIVSVEVINLQRGSTQVAIEYTGTTETLRKALRDQYLVLQQDGATRSWILQPAPITR